MKDIILKSVKLSAQEESNFDSIFEISSFKLFNDRSLVFFYSKEKPNKDFTALLKIGGMASSIEKTEDIFSLINALPSPDKRNAQNVLMKNQSLEKAYKEFLRQKSVGRKSEVVKIIQEAVQEKINTFSVAGPLTDGQKKYVSFALNSLPLEGNDIKVYASTPKKSTEDKLIENFPTQRDLSTKNKRYNQIVLGGPPHIDIWSQLKSFESIISVYMKPDKPAASILPAFITKLLPSREKNQNFLTPITIFDLDEMLSGQWLDELMGLCHASSSEEIAKVILKKIEPSSLTYSYEKKQEHPEIFSIFKLSQIPDLLDLVKTKGDGIYENLLSHQAWYNSISEKDSLQRSIHEAPASPNINKSNKI